MYVHMQHVHLLDLSVCSRAMADREKDQAIGGEKGLAA